jgi:prepilin-type N-terminal cleavage/methylation domain-containing protein
VIGEEGGYSMIEMLVVMTILGVVIGGLVTMFSAGINAAADQNRRFQAQQDGRLALDKMRREIHAGCTISSPATYNTAVTSVTVYFATDNCVSGTHTVSYCTVASGTHYSLYRKAAANCTTPTQKIADFLTSSTIFDYLPPNSHVTTLGGGTGSAAITTQDGSSTLARLHVDMTLNQNTRRRDKYRLVDDIAFRNGPRACATGVASC